MALRLARHTGRCRLELALYGEFAARVPEDKGQRVARGSRLTASRKSQTTKV